MDCSLQKDKRTGQKRDPILLVGRCSEVMNEWRCVIHKEEEEEGCDAVWKRVRETKGSTGVDNRQQWWRTRRGKKGKKGKEKEEGEKKRGREDKATKRRRV